MRRVTTNRGQQEGKRRERGRREWGVKKGDEEKGTTQTSL